MSVNNLDITNSTIRSVTDVGAATVITEVNCMVDTTVTPNTYVLQVISFNETSNTLSVTWYNLTGTQITPTNVISLANVRTLLTIDTTFAVYHADSGGIGYSTNDTIVHAYGLTTSNTPTTAFAFWYNSTTSVIMTAPPSSGSYVLSNIYDTALNSSSGGSLATSVTVTALPALPSGNAVIGAVQPISVPVTPTNYTIVTGATDYILLAANANRKLLILKIPSTAPSPVWVSFNNVAYTGTVYQGLDFPAGSALVLDSVVPNTSIHVASTTPCTISILEG